MLKYPYARPNVTDKDVKAVTTSLKGQYLTGGNIIKSFEDKLTKFFKVKNAIACNSGTAALHLIYKCLGLSEGDAILTTPITFLATANAAKMCGANVIFADVDPNTGLIKPDLIEQKLKNKSLKIKIVTVVHLGGRVCDLEKISKITKKYKCFLIEDACHAPGAYYSEKQNKTYIVGSCKYSIASSFSFHAIKHITMAEGGCVTTNNTKLSNKIRLMLNHSMQKKIKITNKKSIFYQPWYYKVSELGWNYRASEINCALGLSQLRRITAIIKKRKKIAYYYRKEFKEFKHISFPKYAFQSNSNVWHLFTIFIEFKKLSISKSDFIKELYKEGIGSQVHYIPVSSQPLYKKNNSESYKGAQEYYNKNLSIPIYETLKKKDIVFIANTIKNKIMKNLKAKKKKNSK